VLKVTEIDTDTLTLAMDELRRAMIDKGMDATSITVTQTKLLSRTVANFTPPIQGKGQKGSPRLNGEMKIERELNSLFSEAHVRTIDDIVSLHGVKNIDTFRRGSKGLTHILWDQIDATGSRMKEEHNAARGKSGTVYIRSKTWNSSAGKPYSGNTWRARVVVPKGSRKPYIKAVQARVGRAKCSMALVAMRLGDDYPSWISRHKGNVDDIAIAKISLNDPKFPQVTFGSRAPGIARNKHLFRDAVNLRRDATRRNIKLVQSDYKDWRTVRAKANARRRSSSSERPEHVE
jgi:hypothetical protein